ncbi:MAG: cobyric acid synthase [Dehalococcoidia bacterium]|nr:cobyric acid synthase [Dehalococcoidia bacterium]
MVQGTASHVGKSVLVTALCRFFRQDSLRVAPFKAQNMSNNAAVTPDGGEIGRAQTTQAEAAGVTPTVQMNPVLLKPEADNRSQVVLLGRPFTTSSSREYYAMKALLWDAVARSLDALRAQYDVEGAGSPAEVNLKQDDIVNMRVALYANAPVLLVADIDRGGVFASLIGTLDLLPPEERALVKGLVINKFRGDATLFHAGVAFLEQRTGVPVAGVLPYFHDIHIPQEDAGVLDDWRRAPAATQLDIAVIRLPHIANFDDFDPLAREPGISVRYVASLAELGAPDLLILPGTKSTLADLAWLRSTRVAGKLSTLHQSGVPVLGICGGYQMLGRSIRDPLGVETSGGTAALGLGLLDVVTTFAPTKETHRVRASVLTHSGLLAHVGVSALSDYEIHMGRTIGDDLTAPFLITERSGSPVSQPDGAINNDGLVLGTYIHGLFHNAEVRRSIVQALVARRGVTPPPPRQDAARDAEYDKLADLVRAHLDMRLVYRAMGLELAYAG